MLQAGTPHPEAARCTSRGLGTWFAFVSVPVFQFILMRWYVRMLIWFWLLLRVSLLSLRLQPEHPDRAGGLGFVGGSSIAFTPFLFAQGALIAGQLANRILFQWAVAVLFQVDYCGLCRLLFGGSSFSASCVHYHNWSGPSAREMRRFGAICQ